MRGRTIKGALRLLDGAAKLLKRNADSEPPHHMRVGRRGEEEAYFHLRRLGYVMVARNFRSPRHRGEIDLIGWDGDVLCFIEVKTRSTREVKPAEASVDEQKRRDVAAVARYYLRRLNPTPAFRFDIVSVYCDSPHASPQINLFKNSC